MSRTGSLAKNRHAKLAWDEKIPEKPRKDMRARITKIIGSKKPYSVSQLRKSVAQQPMNVNWSIVTGLDAVAKAVSLKELDYHAKLTIHGLPTMGDNTAKMLVLWLRRLASELNKEKDRKIYSKSFRATLFK